MALRDLVYRVNTADAEAVCVSCTSITLNPIAGALEADLGKPVFSANMVTMWHALRLAGAQEPLLGRARLFQLPLPPSR